MNRSENNRSELGNNPPAHYFVPLFQMVTFKQLVKYKTSLGKAESLREFGQWYNNKWKRDYPMAYGNRYGSKRRRLMVTGRSRARKRTYAAVKKMYRAKKNGSAFSRTNIGKRVGESTGKHWAILADWQLLASRTLAKFELTQISRTAGNTINLRQRDIVNLRGFAINFDFQCLGTNFQYVNMAVLSSKEDNDVNVTDFFRSGGLGTTRYLDFDNALSSLQFAHLGINSDKYTILLHKRWKVNRSTRGTGSADWRTYKRYLKVNRQIQYDSEIASSCLDKIFLVIWTDLPGNTQTATPTADMLTYGVHVTTVFKEPKN